MRGLSQSGFPLVLSCIWISLLSQPPSELQLSIPPSSWPCLSSPLPSPPPPVQTCESDGKYDRLLPSLKIMHKHQKHQEAGRRRDSQEVKMSAFVVKQIFSETVEFVVPPCSLQGKMRSETFSLYRSNDRIWVKESCKGFLWWRWESWSKRQRSKEKTLRVGVIFQMLKVKTSLQDDVQAQNPNPWSLLWLVISPADKWQRRWCFCACLLDCLSAKYLIDPSMDSNETLRKW